jgi:hypothetical protein
MRIWGPLALVGLAAIVGLQISLSLGLTPSSLGTLLSVAAPPPVLLQQALSVAELSAAVPLPPKQDAATCGATPNVELAGRVVLWGANHLTDNAGACCDACAAHAECNVWVYCAATASAGATAGCPARECWLKRQDLFHGVPVGIMKSGPETPWTSGHLARFQTNAPDAAALGVQLQPLEPNGAVAVPAARPRECGSPAADAYVSIKPACLEESATAKQFDHSEAARLGQVVWLEEHASYDGLAVAWGVGNKKASAAACADSCRRHVADQPGKPVRHGGLFGRLPCNAFVYCPVAEARCFEPDAHMHTGGDCWLKFTEVPEQPEVNGRGAMTDPATWKNGVAYNDRHPAANKPLVPWISGVLLPPGARPGNGTWGPRALWRR